IVKDDEIKTEIIKGNGIPVLIVCAFQPQFHVETVQQPSLEILRAVSFETEAASIIKEQEKFIQLLNDIVLANVFPQRIPADGILFNLAEHEATMIKDQTKASCVHKRMLVGPVATAFEYDIMISYCHKNRELCHKIYECLNVETCYKVWIDKERMYGSLMARMAEGVEKSEIVLICMSSSYKESDNCKSEAIYAKKRHRYLIPLIVEPKYNPSGWLGVYRDDLLYIDFT
ncbi:unnamed protein product, partial [Didymodactylos carnosus]